ncbi:MAG: hypothetical protein GY717_09810 [Rhodobacteraceae bacterium]|nr:hypothetical protein [Paracoccaceae bacterium]
MLEFLFEVANGCLVEWAGMKPYRFCYAGLMGLYAAEFCGVHDRRLFGLGAALYLALYLV